jgi:hypothetical protein
MKFNLKRNLILIVGALIVFVVSWVRCSVAFKTGQYGVTTSMNFIEARETLGGLDAGSYMQGGMVFANGNYQDPANDFIWFLWPPGMSLANGMLIKIFGISSHPLILWSLISSILVSMLFLVLVLSFVKGGRLSKLIGFAITSIVLLTSPVQGWILDQGIMYAEGVSVVSLILCLYYLSKYQRSLRPEHMIFSSASLAIAIMMRSGNIVILYLILLGICIVFLRSVPGMLTKLNDRSISNNLKNLLLVVTAPLLTAAAWIAFRTTWLQLPPSQWVASPGNAWKGYWQRNSDFKGTGWEITAGVDNWACQVDPATCYAIHANPEANWNYFELGIRVILQKPFAFLAERLPDMWNYWILNGRWLYPPQSRIPAAVSLTEGLIFFLILVVSIISMCMTVRSNPQLILVQSSIMVGSLAPLFIYHLEGRYFIPIKLISAFILVQNLETLVGVKNRFSMKRLNQV